MTRVKICGITSLEDAQSAIDAGADAIGFNFYSKSPRFIEPAAAAAILRRLPPIVNAIGVFVNEERPEKVEEIASIVKLSAIQLHGDETPDYCDQLADWRLIKALRVGEGFKPEQVRRYPVSAILLDGPAGNRFGGSGIPFEWSLAREAGRHARIVLAGGLSPLNVADAIREARPFAVDAANGVERSPGKKDSALIAAFVRAVRSVDQQLGNANEFRQATERS